MRETKSLRWYFVSLVVQAFVGLHRETDPTSLETGLAPSKAARHCRDAASRLSTGNRSGDQTGYEGNSSGEYRF